MKIFSGFPSGKVQVTPLPNVFFTELVPAIDDLAELKVTLHVLWLIAHANSRQQYVRADELANDPTLAQSLAASGVDARETLTRALARAVTRGTLWQSNDLYFVNSEAGRRAHARAERDESSSPRPASRETAGAAPRANIFALYEQNIGLLTPLIAEELKEAEAAYPPGWIADALQIAAENNKRSWSYTRAILERWKTEGRGEKGKKEKPWYDEYKKYVNR